MNVTSKQKEMLLTLLKKDPEIVRGRIDRKSESRRKMTEIWNNIANVINAAAEGPQKSGKEWAKTWKDIKAYILKKEAKRRSHIEGTGGGPPSTIAFSNFEKEVLELLTPEAAGLLNIPEGGINNIKAPVPNISEDDSNIEEFVLNENERDTEEIITQVTETYTQIMKPQDEILYTENNIENVSPNILHQRSKNVNKQAKNAAEKINRKTKVNNNENSMRELSYNMLQIQKKKYKLKKKQLKLQKTALNVQRELLGELKNIKLSIQSWETTETL